MKCPRISGNALNGKNPHSVVIMDNASIHHVDGIMDLIAGVGALLIFLPLYSPDYNPIEASSKVKTLIKAYEEEVEMNHMNMTDIVLTAFSHNYHKTGLPRLD